MASEDFDENMDSPASDLDVPENVPQPDEERLHSPLPAPFLPITMMTCTTDKELKEQMHLVSKINPSLHQINHVACLTNSPPETPVTPKDTSMEDRSENSQDDSSLAKKETLSMEPLGRQSPFLTAQAGRMKSVKRPTMLRELELSESDEDMVMVLAPTENHNQATRGCARCNKDACCPTIHVGIYLAMFECVYTLTIHSRQWISSRLLIQRRR